MNTTNSAGVLAVLDKPDLWHTVGDTYVGDVSALQAASYNDGWNAANVEARAAMADYIRDAERMRFCIERGVFPVIAADGETWCMFVAVTSARRSLFSGKNPSEAIDAALAALAGNGKEKTDVLPK